MKNAKLIRQLEKAADRATRKLAKAKRAGNSSRTVRYAMEVQAYEMALYVAKHNKLVEDSEGDSSF